MSEMLDIVAKAIKEETDKFGSPVRCYIEPEARERWETANPDADPFEPPFDDLESYRIIARATIKAMRELTEEMLNASSEEGIGYSVDARGYVAAEWRKMVDAALKN